MHKCSTVAFKEYLGLLLSKVTPRLSKVSKEDNCALCFLLVIYIQRTTITTSMIIVYSQYQQKVTHIDRVRRLLPLLHVFELGQCLSLESSSKERQ